MSKGTTKTTNLPVFLSLANSHTIMFEPNMPLTRHLDELLNRAKIITLTPDRTKIEKKASIVFHN